MLESRRYTPKSILHARPVAALLKVAKQCECEPFVMRDGKWESAGIINLLMTGAKEGAVIELGAQGESAAVCLERWAELFEADFPLSLDKDPNSKES